MVVTADRLGGSSVFGARVVTAGVGFGVAAVLAVWDVVGARDELQI